MGTQYSSEIRGSHFPDARQGGRRALLLKGVRSSRALKTVLALAVMFAVLTVLIAPSIDMPETVLREHHVASHSVANGPAGTLVVVGMFSDAQELGTEAVLLYESSEASGYAHSLTSVVLRC